MQQMCGEARTKSVGKMHRVNVSKRRLLRLHYFSFRGSRKRSGFVASIPGVSRTNGQAGVLSGLQRALQHKLGVALSGIAVDRHPRSRPSSESPQRFTQATIALR